MIWEVFISWTPKGEIGKGPGAGWEPFGLAVLEDRTVAVSWRRLRGPEL